jgi:hypothetical protein
MPAKTPFGRVDETSTAEREPMETLVAVEHAQRQVVAAETMWSLNRRV